MTHALFFSLIIGYVPRLVARADVGRALAIVGGGASAGFVLGVPLSTSLGTRGRLAGVLRGAGGAVVLCTFVARAADCCRVWITHRTDRSDRRSGRRALAAVSVSNQLTFLGQFTAYTFISVLLLASGVARCSSARFCWCAAPVGFSGCGTSAGTLDRNPRRTAVARPRRHSSARSWYWASPGRCSSAVRRGGRRLECRVRRRAVDLPGVRGTDACGVAGTWPVPGRMPRANVGIAGGAAIGAGLLQTAGLWSLPWAARVWRARVWPWSLLSRRAFPSQRRDAALARGVGLQRRAAALVVDRQLEMPYLVRIDLAQPELLAVGDEPLVGLHRARCRRLFPRHASTCRATRRTSSRSSSAPVACARASSNSRC